MSRHTYSNKGVTLYYELPDNSMDLMDMCTGFYICPSHWTECTKALSIHINSILSGISISIIPPDGNWK